MRIGHGYDIHKITAGDGIILGGVTIPCDYQIVAHSDGDVVIHALCDALLGAMAAGDIGQHFPDTSDENENRDSQEFLHYVTDLMQQKHFQLQNADISIIAQTPKLKDYLPKMQQTLAKILQTTENNVHLKATTHEGLDAIGKKEAIAAHAVVLINKEN